MPSHVDVTVDSLAKHVTSILTTVSLWTVSMEEAVLTCLIATPAPVCHSSLVEIVRLRLTHVAPPYVRTTPPVPPSLQPLLLAHASLVTPVNSVKKTSTNVPLVPVKIKELVLI